MTKPISLLKILFPFIMLFIVSGCSDNLPLDKDISNRSYQLVDQDSSNVMFPHKYEGKTVVMGFIFTNCPDICPMTTHNMQQIQEQLKKNEIENVELVALSFDPLRDTPSVLKEYSNVREIDLSNFSFITGREETIDSLLKMMGVLAISGDTTYTENNNPVYFYTHTDRITLIDNNAHVRKEYRGSKINIDEILNDIKQIGN
ncbi:MAG: hypothetical protein AUK34_02830 [Ignavibacteria bacterium CG2_30_36_16]|nr:SCO family protein [Ignavibacteria bacterium]OIP62763.1 MAG: hypothetical protein AUK34_02830 [Ignavibacteria bacterium CG2_30_36_16]PJA99449.1 MAG: SCO family protein [Ignavibacteria bacterium CG_4_9_14_3_um_filter_36_18]